MPWFKVDDSFHSHPKVMATEAAALGLWVIAGSWCSSNLTDGFVPDHVLPRLLPGSAKLAKKLIAAGLWVRAERGYLFHDWQCFNPTAEQVRADRASTAERQRRFRENRNGVTNGGSNGVTHGVSHSAPTRPDPTRGVPVVASGGGRPGTSARAPNATTPGRPPDRCSAHSGSGTEPGPCRGCMRAREHAEQWDGENRRERMVATRACTHCDVEGWRIDPRNPHRGPLTPGVRCNHVPWSAEQIQEHVR